ncbi:hypothetical protein NYO67_12991 [Aspergillus flavus]|nr:hypothetical protein NYO67_12991 [Aspergillus flavus]
MFSSITAKLKTQLPELQDTMADQELLNIIKTQHHIPCLAHVIQLTTTALLRKLSLEASNDDIQYNWENGEETLIAHQGIARTIEKVRKIVKFINTSPRRRERFQLSQRLGTGSALLLLLDCKTRWNSTYLMIRRALKLRQSVENFIQYWDNSDISHLQPTPVEWRQLEYLIELLYPFYIFTTCLSDNQGPTVHKVYDIYNNLFDHLDTSIDRLVRKRAPWKQQILDGLRDAHQKLRKYYRRTYHTEGYIYAIATILDPTLKLETFKKGPWLDDNTDWAYEYRQVFEGVFNLYRCYNPNVDTQSTVSGPLSGLDRAFYHVSKRRKKSPLSEIFEELKTYLDLEGTTGQTDILTYWKSRRDDFPILYCMARDFLAVTTNGVGVERLFNSARDICHYR